MKHLVLGGARSGKSTFARQTAEQRAADTGTKPIMIVTAQAFDDEMRARIAAHQAERRDLWRTIEAPIDLPEAVDALEPGDVAVIDCLTLWLSNLMLGDHDIEAGVDDLCRSVQSTKAWLAIVSNEVGWGIVPDNALARRFRDDAGRLNQRMAEIADRVDLIVAGYAVTVKSNQI
jgi:adenosylcobinamide kinase/adenosylcobinamide-phosphate guanylyltransferase